MKKQEREVRIKMRKRGKTRGRKGRIRMKGRKGGKER